MITFPEAFAVPLCTTFPHKTGCLPHLYKVWSQCGVHEDILSISFLYVAKKHYICGYSCGRPLVVRHNMNSVYLKIVHKIILFAAGVTLCGCSDFQTNGTLPEHKPVKVVLAVSGAPETRTAYDAECRGFVWQSGDAVSVWAKSAGGTFELDGQTFSLLATGLDKSSAYFSATLQSGMTEGTYSYYIAYPLPDSAEGGKAVFTVPAVQDGIASGGVDIIVAGPVEGQALTPIETGSPVLPDNVMKFRMKHLLHFLKFYIPEGGNVLGEPVTRIEFSMPKAVAGKVSVDISDAAAATLDGGTKSVTLELKEPVGENGAAVAGIFPPQTEYSSSDQMLVTIYSENKWASLAPLPLKGRTFAAGHLTPVPLRPSEARQLYKLRFTLASNNLGEDPYGIKLALPDGMNWPGSGSNVLELVGTHDGLIKTGDTFVVETKDEAAFRALSSRQLTVSYESESALVTESLTLGDLTSVSTATCSLNCPYLFYEDFSGVESFSSNDEYGISSAGSKSPHTFLSGWSAARAGAQAGTAIRIACRRETGLANYSARADSPFLSGLKEGKTVSLNVVYDYSMDRKGTPKIAQTVYFGYITTSGNLKSGDDTGTFTSNFDINETTGSYDNINHTADVVLSDVTAPLRLSWRTVPETNWGANNNTCWLYIDNIKVKIK